MLPLTVGLLVMALIAGLFGYGFIASSFMAVAHILFFVLLALAALSFFFIRRVPKRGQA
jgi:uncharacterized membrane protein YtjA (UPF0391 family)